MTILYDYSILYVKKKIEAGSKEPDKFDKDFIELKKSVKIILYNVTVSLNIINTINH
jgi:hypothetical protein